MDITGKIVKKQIDGQVKWVYEEDCYDGWGAFPYTRNYVFDTYYDAEHSARIRSNNEKYTSNFTRVYDKFGKETYNKKDVVFEIVIPDYDRYRMHLEYNRDLDRRIRQYNNSFWRKLFKFWFKPEEDYYDLDPVKVRMYDNNSYTDIFEGKDWGEAEAYIREFVKTNPIYKINNGDVERK